MSRFRRYLSMTILIAAGMIVLPSYAKPDLTTPVDMSLLHAKDTGYQITYHDFSAAAPELPSSLKTHSTTIQTYAKPRYYRVWLATPKQYANHQPAEKLVNKATKVLYILDGNAAIDDLNKDTLLSLSNSSLQDDAPNLVFIGYQTPYRFDIDARAYDYTPPLLGKDRLENAFQENGRERLNGGAESFYTLIEKEIKPWVYEQLGEKPKQEAIWGHSYGGLFVLCILFTHPEAYEHYFSADPSLWWQEGEMIRYWQAFQNLPKAQLSDITRTKKLQLTFSQSLQQTNTPTIKPPTIKPPATAVPSNNLDKDFFASDICNFFQKNCSYQFYNQSHGEVFTTSLLESLRRF